MDIQLLLAGKGSLEKEPVAIYMFNRLNMLNSNVVMNCHF